MSKPPILQDLENSTDPLDIEEIGAVKVISRRVLDVSRGFEEVDSRLSYEAIVLKHHERFDNDVIAAARQRLKLAAKFPQQDIQYFIKARSIELFDEPGETPSARDWIGLTVQIPKLHKKNRDAEAFLAKNFRSFIWFHEQKNEDGGEDECGKGLTAVVDFRPIQAGQKAKISDAFFFEHPVGEEILQAHKGDGGFFSRINADRRSRTWPVFEDDVEEIFSAVREKVHEFAVDEHQDPDPNAAQSLETIEENTALRQVVQRGYQSVFRKTLLAQRPNQCAITGTSEVSVLEAAHIIPYATKFANRDKPENGLLLRRNIHKLFDEHLISINPSTMEVEVGDTIRSPDYLSIQGKIVEDSVSTKSLDHHFSNFNENQKEVQK